MNVCLTLSPWLSNIGAHMKVGSRGDYGMRALVYLASLTDTASPVQIHAIAERQQIPEDYLRQLLGNLRAAGLVRSVRGPHGGYLLAKAPDQITMAEVLEVLEGPPEDMHCSFHCKLSNEMCSLLGGCKIRASWRQAITQMQVVLRETTLWDLIAETPLVREKAETKKS